MRTAALFLAYSMTYVDVKCYAGKYVGRVTRKLGNDTVSRVNEIRENSNATQIEGCHYLLIGQEEDCAWRRGDDEEGDPVPGC
jgi:hypothetical protein